MGEEMDSENKDNKSEAPELPPGWEWQGRVAISHATGRHVSRGGGAEGNAALCWDAWQHKSGITREQWAHAQECVRRLPEVEAERDALSFACGMYESRLDCASAILASTREALVNSRSEAEGLRDADWERHLDTLDDPSMHDGCKPLFSWEPTK